MVGPEARAIERQAPRCKRNAGNVVKLQRYLARVHAGEPDKDNVNWTKFGKGFLYHDPANADNIKGYKFPVGDIVNGQFKINRAALAAAAGKINQSSGIYEQLARGYED